MIWFSSLYLKYFELDFYVSLAFRNCDFMTSGLLLTGSHIFCVCAGWQNHSSTSATTFTKIQSNPDPPDMLK